VKLYPNILNNVKDVWILVETSRHELFDRQIYRPVFAKTLAEKGG